MMSNSMIPLPGKYKTLLPKTLYQQMKALEDELDNKNNPALLYWARKSLLREALETEEDALPINTEGMPWYKEDAPKFVIYDDLLEASVMFDEVLRPDTAILRQTIMPLPATCLKLKTTHPELYTNLMDCENSLTRPVNHEKLYECRRALFVEHTITLRQKLHETVANDFSASESDTIIEEISYLDECFSPIYVGDAYLGGS